VWELIQHLKKNRVVILTSHSMEEADLLSDRLVVMVDGKFKCIGTSLYLKNNFGDGYRISIITSNPQAVFDFIKRVIPSVSLVDQSAGSLVLSISHDNLNEIVRLFEILEAPVENTEGSEIAELITDWGLSQTTLEEVFCRVTAKKESDLGGGH
jgi:ABC-type multidrug transport system ATPase subunit